ncbi:MAG: comEC [Burkholderiaceae bacterium]|nr:comEC [Burkholderiaceae bacterium]
MHQPWRFILLAVVALWAVCVAFAFDAPWVGAKYLFVCAWVCAVAFVWWARSHRSSAMGTFTAILLCALLAFSWAQWRWSERSAHTIPAEWNTQVQMVQVRIISMPTRTDYGWRMLIQPESAQIQVAPNTPAQMSLSWADDDLPLPISSIRVGQTWRLPVHIRTPHASKNEGVFDQSRYWLANNIMGLAYVRVYKNSTPEQMPQLLATHHSVLSMIENWRFDTLQAIDATLSEANHSNVNASGNVFKALALGDQAAVSAWQWQLFQDTGVTHLVSISGLHVTVLAGILALCARWAWRRNVWLTTRIPAMHVAQWVGLIGALVYALLSGWGLPAQRTVWMLALWLGLARLGVARSGLRVLGFSVFWILIFDPFAVLSVGFWLSYGAVAWLIVAFDSFAVIKQSDEDMPKHRQLARWLIGLMGAQLGISLSLLPMTLYFFRQTSLLGVGVNFLAIPLMTVLLVPLLLSVMVLALTGWGEPVVWMNGVLGWLLNGLQYLQGWAKSSDWLGRIELWQVLALFVLSLCLVVWVRKLWHGEPLKRAWRFVGAAVLAIIVVINIPPNYPRVQEGQLRVTVFDVGQGSAVLLQSAHQNWLYDAGARFSSDADAGARIIVPHLRYIGVTQIDTLVLSHNDSDHTGGTQSVLNALPVRRMITSLNVSQRASLGIEPIPVNLCVAGQTEQFDGVRMAVLSPDAQTLNADSASDNQKSCALRFEVSSAQPNALKSILLTGDMDMWSEANMVVDKTPNGVGLRTVDALNQTPLQTDIVLMPHHGSDSSSSAPLIDATQPKWAVAQAGMYNAFRHPRAEVVQRYQAAGAQIWRTDIQFSRVFILGQ